MATVTPTPEARERNSTPQQVPFFSAELRYTVPQAAWLLKKSVSQTWSDIGRGKLQIIREGGRTYVPGSVIVQRSTVAT